jgi:hypothetical protein
MKQSQQSGRYSVLAALPLAERQIIEPGLMEMSRGMRLPERAEAEGRLQIRDPPDLEPTATTWRNGRRAPDGSLMLACPVDPKRRGELVARSVRLASRCNSSIS